MKKIEKGTTRKAKTTEHPSVNTVNTMLTTQTKANLDNFKGREEILTITVINNGVLLSTVWAVS